MYFPYFRGKQYELLTIRETAPILSSAKFVPIIEPVKESLKGLTKALRAVMDASGEAVVIVNPRFGDYMRSGEAIWSLIQNEFEQDMGISIGILLSEGQSVHEVMRLCSSFSERTVTLIHAGFTKGRSLARELGGNVSKMHHVFFQENCGKLYQKHFKDGQRILLRDGFEKRTNRSHPSVEFFSDLHATYEDEGMNGFVIS